MKRTILLSVMMLLVVTAMQASAWTVTNSGSIFTISRSSSAEAETVNYRTVNLSAYAGQHYTAVRGSLTFSAGETSKTVTVTETTPATNAYKYQNGTSRNYRFEVLDANDFQLAYCDRSMTIGTNVSSTLYNEKSYGIKAGSTTITDAGYGQTGMPLTASSTIFYSSEDKSYLSFLSGIQLRMALRFEAREVNDGYQYVQILTDQTSNYDVCGSGNGNPGTPNYSRYLACFEIMSGSVDDSWKYYTFPVTSAGDNESDSNPWLHGTKYPLTIQKFNTSCRASNGQLIIPVTFSTLSVRFDASGNGADDWQVYNVTAYITAIDGTNPTIINTSSIAVNAGTYVNGTDFYISVPFSEIVTVTGTPTLSTTWGTASYLSGSGSNVLTFKGTIGAAAGTTLAISSFSGTVRDLYGNYFSGSISKTFTGTTAEWPDYTLAQNADNSALLTDVDGKTANMTRTRTLNAGGWNTFCAPFDISSSQIASVFGDGTKVRQLSSSSFDNTTKGLTLNFADASSIEAGKAYLVYIGCSAAVSNPTFPDVTVSNATTTTETTYADFVPVMNPTPVTGGDKTVLFVSGGNQLTYPGSTGNINGFRAYFHIKDDAAVEARSVEMTFDDGETTGVWSLTTNRSPSGEGSMYTLSGQRVVRPVKGLYIVNGKKLIIK